MCIRDSPKGVHDQEGEAGDEPRIELHQKPNRLYAPQRRLPAPGDQKGHGTVERRG